MTYQIRVALKRFTPRIWRRILISSDTLLPDLHMILQVVMGWTNSHLHQFVKDGNYYMDESDDDNLRYELKNVDYSRKRISDLLKKEKDKIIYEYDFGDGWVHDVILEKILENDEKILIPTCLTGKNNCPPEDCGGVWGYDNMLEILKDPDHEEFQDYQEWLGDDFDPTYFDKDVINGMLKSMRFNYNNSKLKK